MIDKIVGDCFRGCKQEEQIEDHTQV